MKSALLIMRLPVREVADIEPENTALLLNSDLGNSSHFKATHSGSFFKKNSEASSHHYNKKIT